MDCGLVMPTIYVKVVLENFAEETSGGVENAIMTEDGLSFLTAEDGLYYIAY